MAEAALARERLFALRSEIGRLESLNASALARTDHDEAWDAAGQVGSRDRVVSGAEGFDAALGGGLARAALHEVRSPATSDNGAASGFALALGRLALGGNVASQRLLWIADPTGARESGRPYGPGLAAHGIPPAAILHASPRHLKDALVIAEAGLAVKSFAAVILEVYGNPPKFGLTESRRLNLRAKAHRRPLLLLRERGEEEASSALVRFAVRSAPAAPRLLPGGRLYPQGIGNPVFHVTVEKSRNPSPPEFMLEWNADECLFRTVEPGRFALPDPRAKDPVAPFSLSRDRPHREDALGQVLALPRAS
jgi:protein ImuA